MRFRERAVRGDGAAERGERLRLPAEGLVGIAEIAVRARLRRVERDRLLVALDRRADLAALLQREAAPGQQLGEPAQRSGVFRLVGERASVALFGVVGG